MHECPLCGADMVREDAEPDVGIMVDAWVCTVCEHFEAADVDDESDYMDDAARES